MQLRPYQKKAIDLIRNEIIKGHKKILLVLPTGAGKTIVMSDIASKTLENGHKILAIMHRRQLVYQMVDRFNSNGVKAEMIMSGVEHDLDCSCQVTTVQTYSRRLKLSKMENNRFFIDAAVLLADEAHHIMSGTHAAVTTHYKGKITIGVTATPCLGSGAGLGDYFDSIIQPVRVKELIDSGFLVPARYFGAEIPDLSKVKTVLGDYAKKEIGNIMAAPKLVGDVVDNWLRIAGNRKTLCFAVNVAHSKALCDDFVAKGVTAEHLDAYSDDDKRNQVIDRFKSGKTQILLNVALYTEGTDIPEIEAIILARPTKSLGLHLQMLGRGARPCEGKKDFLVLDHGGNVQRLGYYEDDITWTLDSKKQASQTKKKRELEKKIRKCEMCSTLFSGCKCPNCFHEIKGFNKIIEIEKADLQEMPKNKEKKKEHTVKDMEKFHQMLVFHKIKKGYKDGWVYHIFKNKFKFFPSSAFKNLQPLPPDKGFKNYMTFLNIRKALRR